MGIFKRIANFGEGNMLLKPRPLALNIQQNGSRVG
jgi:hypothetical protein